MKKLKLHLDDLRIDSFDTTSSEKSKGTVFGEQCTCWTQCGQNTCPGCPTCDQSCNGTCVASCYGTCGDTCDTACETQKASCLDTCNAYTCTGYYTYGPLGQPCVFCWG